MYLNKAKRLPLFFILLLLGEGVLLHSCSEKGGDPTPSGPVPVINSITPASGQVASPVTISGLNMSQDCKIYFPGPNNTTIQASLAGTGSISGEKVLYTHVPAGAVTGKIKVDLKGAVGTSTIDFTVITPTANLTISPTSGAAESTVVLTGTTFATTASGNEVTFLHSSGGRTTALISEVSPTGNYLVVRVPENVAEGDIQVRIGDNIYASTVPFKIRPCNVSTLAGGEAGFADGQGTAAKFQWGEGMATIGTTLYVADANNNRIRKVDLTTGQVTTFAGSDYGFADGVGTAAKFNRPTGITVGTDGQLYITDSNNNRIRKVDPQTAQVTTVAGNATSGTTDGTGTAAILRNPSGITTAADGTLYFTQGSDSHAVRQLNPTTGQVTTIVPASTGGYVDGPAATAKFSFPEGIAVANGYIYVADEANERIRRINLTDKTVSTFAGGTSTGFSSTDGLGLNSSFNAPRGMITDGTFLYIADVNLIRRVDLASAAVSTMVGYNTISFSPKNGACGDAEFDKLKGIARAADGSIYVTETTGFSTDQQLIRKIVP